MQNNRRYDIHNKIMNNIKVVWRGHSTECWEWQGSTSGNQKENDRNSRGHGYGRVSINGVTCAVHRVIYTHYFGFIPPKKQVDHLCKNRLCCNPNHLELVSHKTNCKRRDFNV